MIHKMNMKRMGLVLAAVLTVVLSQPSHAYFADPNLSIEAGGNKPTLTVRYKNADVSKIELQIDGISQSVKDVLDTSTSGEAVFSMEASKFAPGTHVVQVHLYDASGKIIISGKRTISVALNPNSPLSVSVPSFGSEISGYQEIDIHMADTSNKPYVSIFIDSKFKTLRNFPPYNYTWDTTQEVNGWHEISALSFDDLQNTIKSAPVKVYVNNPGGRTERQNPDLNRGVNVKTSMKPVKVSTIKFTPTKSNMVNASYKPAVVRPHSAVKTNSKPVVKVATPKSVKKAVHGAPIVTSYTVHPPTHFTATLKRTEVPKVKMMGQRLVKPAQKTTSIVKAIPKAHIAPIQKPISKSQTINLTWKVKIAESQKISYLTNGKLVTFDVHPFITDGVPMTPIRKVVELGGGTVNWDNTRKSVHAFRKGKDVYLVIGQDSAVVNKKNVPLQQSVFLLDSRTIVPATFFADGMKAVVKYDPVKAMIQINFK